MKSFIFAGLVAAAAALPQYGNAPSYGGSKTSAAAVTTSAAAGSYPVNSVAPTSTKKSACRKKHKTTTLAGGYPTLAVGTSDGVQGAASTGASHHYKKTKTASKHGHKTKTSGAAGYTGTPSGAQSKPTSSPAGNGTTSSGSSSAAPSSNGTAADNSAFLRGINVGNWLILEKWMDGGSAFSGKFGGAQDQWTFDSIDGSEAALQKHWSSWFTEDDVAKIASYGFNALRIPIGFWAFDNSGTPYKQGAAYWMDQAIGWASKHNMKVLVDLHGSPGSQNGQDHSGHSGKIDWQQGDNLAKSTKILVQMAKKYGAQNYSSTVWGLEMVNEPTANQPNNFGKSQSWAQDAYEQMYKALDNKALRIVTHDSFMGPQKFVDIANNLAQKLPVAAKVLGGGKTNAGTTFGVDQHDYQLYTDSDNSLDQKKHIQNVCGWADNLKKAHGAMPTIVGEWSSLTNICVKDDGSTSPSKNNPGGSCTSADPSKWSKALVEQVRRYVEAQLDVYEQNTDGYFLWSWKGPGGWGVEGPVKAGAFPSHVVNDRKYKGQCGGK